MPSLWNTVAGAFDHAAGSTDEATGRFFSGAERIADTRDAADPDRRLGPAQRFTGYTRLLVRHTAGEGTEDLIFTSPSGSFLGNEDETNVVGPGFSGEGSVIDAAVSTEGERTSNAERTTQLLLALAGLVGLLYLLGPALQAGAEIASEADDG